MENERKVLGKASQWTCFAVEEKLKLFSVASEDGLILIFSNNNTPLFEGTIEKINHLLFLSKEGSLIGLGCEFGLHLWLLNNESNLYSYKFYQLEFDSVKHLNNIMVITSIHECKNNLFENFSSGNIPILIGFNDGAIEMCIVKESCVIRSNSIKLEKFDMPKAKIDQILMTKSTNGILRILLLVNKILVEIECSIGSTVETDSENESINFEFLKTIRKIEFDFSHVELVESNRLIITTFDGRFGIIDSSENVSENMESFIKNILIFPYGPFPCKSIDKCLAAKFLGIKGKCYVFSGGMPAVTYNHLNAVSVSVEDEPEVCFIFNDIVVDFKVISYGLEDENKILVLTTTECVVISHNDGVWKADNKGQIFPFSKSQITKMSNIVEVENYEINDDSGISTDDRIENRYKNSQIKLFAASYDNGSVSTWFLTPDQCFFRESVNLNNFYNSSSNKEKEKRVLWPKFQKCGIWKSPSADSVIIESIRLISVSNELFYLIISTNRKSLFLFKVNPTADGKSENKTCHKQWCHHHISNNNVPMGNYQINTTDNTNSDYIYLMALITFGEEFDSLIVDFTANGNILSFVSKIGFCCVDIINGRHLFLPLSVFKIADNSKTGQLLTERLQRKIRKRKSLEYSLGKLETNKMTDQQNCANLALPRSIFLWQNSQNKFELFLGFSNGSIIAINFILDITSDFCIEKEYRKLFTNTNQEIINLYVFETQINPPLITSSPSASMKILIDNSSEVINQTDNQSIFTNASPDLNSSCATDGNSSFNDNISMRSSKSKTVSFNWIKSRQSDLKKKILLLRIDKYSLKVIEYYKMKTRFKFKVQEYFMKDGSMNALKKKNKSLDISIPIIIESRIQNIEDSSLNSFCFLFLSDMSILQLSLPNLCALKTFNLNMGNLNFDLVSLDSDIVLVAENFKCSSQLNILGNWKYRNCKLIPEVRINQQRNSKEVKNEVFPMDFMKEAKMSLNSLLW